MATYTIEFHNAIEATGGELTFDKGMAVLKNSNIGLEHYPIFDEAHRAVLNSHIISQYHGNEIAHETVDIFRLRLSAHMALHMPTFNERYKLALTEFDPLVSYDMETTGKTSGDQLATTEAGSMGNAKSKAGARNVNLSTPGVALSGNADYADSAVDATQFQDSDSTSSDTSTSVSEAGSESESRTKGYGSYPADLLVRAQSAILNIDLMVVESLDHLFFGLWANSNEYRNGLYHA